MKRPVFFISDRTGITVEMLGHTLLTQFDDTEFDLINCPFIDSAEKVAQTVSQINLASERGYGRPLVFSSLVDPALRAQASRCDGLFLDLFDTFIHPLESELGVRSSHTVGRSHGMGINTTYKARMDAVNFVLANDDGASTHQYPDANIILIGVSRSGKTPTCLYLALHYGILAANYPLTEEDLESERLPKSLAPFRDRLFGLTIDPIRLQKIRHERRPDGPYASIETCRQEVQAAKTMYQREKIAFLDTSAVSIEEIATTIIQQTGLQRRI